MIEWLCKPASINNFLALYMVGQLVWSIRLLNRSGTEIRRLNEEIEKLKDRV